MHRHVHLHGELSHAKEARERQRNRGPYGRQQCANLDLGKQRFRLAHNIAAGLEVRPPVVERHVREQMPFMATERWLMLGVQAGGDRQALHEVVRRHSLAVAEAVASGATNDLIDRLAGDPAFAAVDRATLAAELSPSRYVGRAPEQVGEFLGEYLAPVLAQARPHARGGDAGEIRV